MPSIPSRARHRCEACDSSFDDEAGSLLCGACLAVYEESPAVLRRSAHEKDDEKNRAWRMRAKTPSIPHRGTDADYARHIEGQGSLCAICRALLRKRTDGVIDHNHRTGEIRGVLCVPCNAGLGLLGDHPEILVKAIEYLSLRGYYGHYPRRQKPVSR